MVQFLFMVALVLVSIFMILLILIQRGKGGGLVGAFGGAGGQSAFGTKAGDTFTVITIVTALLWFSLCIGTVWFLAGDSTGIDLDSGKTLTPTSETLETGAPAAGAAPSTSAE